MKKLIALLLALTMVFALVACGSSSTSDEAASADTSDAAAVEEEAAPAEEEEAAPAESTSDSDLPFDVANLGDPIELYVTCGFGSTEDANQLLQYCMDLIVELSEGNITFEAHMGDGVSTPLEDGGNIASGASDFGVMLETVMAEQLVTWQYSGYGRTLEEAMENANYIFFDNPETAAITQAEAEAANLKILAGNVTGHTGLVFKKEVTSYSEVGGLIYGTEIGGDTFKAMGMSVYTSAVTDEYENLSRGVVDATGAGLSGVYSNKWYEVAPYVLMTNETHVSYWLSMNLDVWNSLSADQQALIEYACKQTSEYSIENAYAYEEVALAEMEEEGATINWLSTDDDNYSCELKHAMNYLTYSGLAATQGKSDEFDTVVQATLDWFGYDLDELTEKYAEEIARVG